MYKLILALLLSASLASAQTDPRTLPAVTLADITYVGSFTAPASDGIDFTPPHMLDWGASGMGMGPDGQSLYIACHNQTTAYARISIPAIGQQARIVETCKFMNLSAINPTDPNAKRIGGVLPWNGRTIVSAYSYYDGNKTAVASHFTDGLGPFRVGTLNPGFVGGYMGVIPQEWRSLLGGPALTGQCCLSTVNRTSYGPSVSVFDPAQVGVVSPVPSTMLVGYPEAHQTIGGFLSAGNTTGFGMATTIAGVAFMPGTSTVLFVGTQPTTFCYGTGTSTQALHGTPDGQGNVYCYDPGNGSKGTHGFPYFESVWGYNAGDLADVRAGLKNPWDVRPTFIARLPSGLNLKCLSTATADPATKLIYARGCGTGTTVFVWKVNVGTTPPPQPPAEVCGDGLDNDGDGLVDEGCAPPPATNCIPGTPRLLGETKGQCVGGSHNVIQQWTRDGDIAETNGGQACSPLPYTLALNELCDPPTANLTIFTAVKTCRVTIQSQPPDQLGGWGVQFRWDQSNFGSRDSSAPFERARDFAAGTYQLGAIWTKTGQTPVYMPTHTYECK